jgi:hypothetical protein
MVGYRVQDIDLSTDLTPLHPPLLQTPHPWHKYSYLNLPIVEK